MTELDYEKLGFMCGIEIHQQLEGRKLFCGCPTEIRKGNPDFQIIRRLRASAGEEGKVDQAALHEQKKQKDFVYQGYYDITCNVELDEEPPHSINPDALHAALQVAKMLNCKVVDEIQVMRKTVIDGSNTSGFQRTALIGMNGWLEVNGKRITVESVCLEEEACQIVERTKTKDTYNLSRLGIPLIEVATGPDIRTPEEAKEVSANIGMILRSTGKCKRGIGTIRQDVNLSVKETARVEIKGFQDLRSIPKIIEYELRRRLKLIEKGKQPEKEVRKAEPDLTTSFLRPMPGMDRMYPETDIPAIPVKELGLDKIEIPELIDDQLESLKKKYKMDKDKIKKLMSKTELMELFQQIADENKNIKPAFIYETIVSAKSFNLIDHKEDFRNTFQKLTSGELTSSSIEPIINEMSKGKRIDFSKYQGIDNKKLESEVIHLIKEYPEAPINGLMGLLMKKHRGQIDGKKAMEVLRKHLKQ